MWCLVPGLAPKVLSALPVKIDVFFLFVCLFVYWFVLKLILTKRIHSQFCQARWCETNHTPLSIQTNYWQREKGTSWYLDSRWTSQSAGLRCCILHEQVTKVPTKGADIPLHALTDVSELICSPKGSFWKCCTLSRTNKLKHCLDNAVELHTAILISVDFCRHGS